ncbi:MAG: PIN domain nuclease [Chloroflexi bacterium]|nr:PIN domain nuclease [Chloroflexota bacterium]
MILVDTSVWIDFLAGRDTLHVRMLDALVDGREDICLCGLVLTEVLQGIRDDTEYRTTKAMLSELIMLPMMADTFILAADIYRLCRSRGITIRNPVDCMIAAVCIQHDVPLLHHDRDFDTLSSVCKLHVVDVRQL